MGDEGNGTSRRRFLGLAGATAATALVPASRAVALDAMGRALGAPPALPATGVDAPFDHVVVLMMENRSFDHLLGWVPGADGRQKGLEYKTRNG